MSPRSQVLSGRIFIQPHPVVQEAFSSSCRNPDAKFASVEDLRRLWPLIVIPSSLADGSQPWGICDIFRTNDFELHQNRQQSSDWTTWTPYLSLHSLTFLNTAILTWEGELDDTILWSFTTISMASFKQWIDTYYIRFPDHCPRQERPRHTGALLWSWAGQEQSREE